MLVCEGKKGELFYSISDEWCDGKGDKYALLVSDAGALQVGKSASLGLLEPLEKNIINGLSGLVLELNQSMLQNSQSRFTFTECGNDVIVFPLLEAAAGPQQVKNRSQLEIKGLQWHHIIPNNPKLKELKNHPLLKLIQYNKESTRNYILLPNHEKFHASRQVHNGAHVQEYEQEIKKELDKIYVDGKKERWTKEQYQEAVFKMVAGVRADLKRSTIALNRSYRVVTNPKEGDPQQRIYESIEKNKAGRNGGSLRYDVGQRYGQQANAAKASADASGADFGSTTSSNGTGKISV